MKRRTFLLTASAAATAPALPLVPLSSPTSGFWAQYLAALHGKVPASTVATFSARPALPAVVAASQGARATGQADKLARRLVKRLVQETDMDPETEDSPQ